MTIRKAQFPGQIWDGTATDRASRNLEIDPQHPSYDQIVAEVISTQQYALSISSGSGSIYNAEAGSNLQKGMPIYIDGTGRLQAARNDMVAAHGVAGLVLEDISQSSNGNYLTDGSLALNDWTSIAGVANLTPGAIYYLGATPGTITATAPTTEGSYVVPLGRAQSTTALDIEIGRAVRL